MLGQLEQGVCPFCGGEATTMREEELTGKEWTELGVSWLELEPPQDAAGLKCFRKAALLGDPWGICNLGWCMEEGIGTEADPRQAVWLYRQAAELGYTPALCHLGVCLETGNGTVAQPEEAVACYTQAAEDTIPRAMQMLASCYWRGVGVKKDRKKALL